MHSHYLKINPFVLFKSIHKSLGFFRMQNWKLCLVIKNWWVNLVCKPSWPDGLWRLCLTFSRSIQMQSEIDRFTAALYFLPVLLTKPLIKTIPAVPIIMLQTVNLRTTISLNTSQGKSWSTLRKSQNSFCPRACWTLPRTPAGLHSKTSLYKSQKNPLRFPSQNIFRKLSRHGLRVESLQ